MRFTIRSARSSAISLGFGAVIAVETVGLHLWLVGRHPLLAWALTALSVCSIAWLAGDFIALGRGFVEVTEDAVTVRAGWRANARLPRSSIASAIRPTWRDLPAGGEPGAKSYVNVAAPTEPNVLLSLAPPTTIRLFGGMRREVHLLGLRLDEPGRLVEALSASA